MLGLLAQRTTLNVKTNTVALKSRVRRARRVKSSSVRGAGNALTTLHRKHTPDMALDLRSFKNGGIVFPLFHPSCRGARQP
jgi:hypothetical protein